RKNMIEKGLHTPDTQRGTRLDFKTYALTAKRHSHDFHQVVLPLTGYLEIEIEGLEDTLSKDKAAIISAGRMHGFQGVGENRFLVMDMPLERSSLLPMRRRLFESASRAPFIALDSGFNGLTAALAGEFSGKFMGRLESTAISNLLLSALSERMGLSALPGDERLVKALEHVERQLMTDPAAADLSIEGLSGAAGTSASKLHDLFRSHLGKSPGRYVSERKLEEAALLLDCSRASISEVAFDVGYNDQSSFTRAFVRHFAKTPKEYRNRGSSSPD
ncbi:MAG: AraC family transcriptional regulator, partial [Kiloniellales bacterium]|nr:AraC family transcriptional regulator [Kiloniellales bacterium]